MNKLKFLFLCLSISLSISCTRIMPGGDTTGDKNAKIPITNRPNEIKNSSPDAHAADAKAIIVSVLGGNTFYVGAETYEKALVSEYVKKMLDANPSERQLIYLNADGTAEYGSIVEALDNIRKNKVENIGLLVSAAKNDTQSSILKVKIPAESEIDDTEKQKKYPFLQLDKDGKINFAKFDANKGLITDKPEVKLDEVGGKLSQMLKEKPDKTVRIKASRSTRYNEIVHLVDAAAGAGATTIYLELDDLSL